jgi:molybdopterin molybdotransferase
MNDRRDSYDDPRMRGFRARASVEDVVAAIDARVHALPAEAVALRDAGSRVLAASVVATVAAPPFDRSAMDGYALRGEETFGADSYNPALFRLIGRSRPGRAFAGVVGAGEAVEITTGAPIPEGADAVVRAEGAIPQGDLVRVTEPTPPRKHVGRVGEDVEPGDVVLEMGRVLRPQDLGVLSAIGVGAMSVIRRPRVFILVTGDELLPPGTMPTAHQIADMNSVMLSELVHRDGGEPSVVGPMRDDRDAIEQSLRQASRSHDVILVSGGSSTGPEDHAPGIVAQWGEIVAHGVALRPASPAGLGFLEGTVPVALLPGNPVSCLCAYDFFAGRIVRRLGGRSVDWPYRAIDRPLERKLVSALGRVDYARVRVTNGRVEPLAISGASILSSTTRADGFVVIPADREGYPEGSLVTVWLYDV